MSAPWRVLLLFLAIAIAALLLMRLWSEVPVAPSPVVKPVAPSTPPVASLSSAPPAAVETTPADKAPPINPALVKGFSTSINYRDFIAFAKRDIAPGGGAYAIQAEVDCDFVKAVLEAVNHGSKEASPDSRNIVARAEARTLLEARCGTLMQQEVGARTSFELKRSGKDRLDPMLQLRDQFYDPRFKADRAYRDAFVARVVEMQDPLMWTRYASRLVDSDSIAGTASFDGVAYSGTDYLALVAAIELVPCALRFDCARLDTNVAVACLQHHVCAHDRFELEKLRAAAQRYDFLRVLVLHEALITALKMQRVAVFIKS